MEQREQIIKQDNRKAKKGFFVVLLVNGLLGGVIGFCGAVMGTDGLTQLAERAGLWFGGHAHWLGLACVLAMPLVSLPLYRKAKGMLRDWDGEEDGVLTRVDDRLSRILWINSTLGIVLMFLISASYAGGIAAYGRIGWAALVLLAGGAVNVTIQRRVVDMARLMYPEKEGSVYDLNFRKKWMDSCDEAEKILIGQCAYRAYTAAATLCGVLWGVFTLSGMFLNTGFLPCLAVCIIWGGTQWVYCHWSVKLSQPGTSVL